MFLHFPSSPLWLHNSCTLPPFPSFTSTRAHACKKPNITIHQQQWKCKIWPHVLYIFDKIQLQIFNMFTLIEAQIQVPVQSPATSDRLILFYFGCTCSARRNTDAVFRDREFINLTFWKCHTVRLRTAMALSYTVYNLCFPFAILMYSQHPKCDITSFFGAKFGASCCRHTFRPRLAQLKSTAFIAKWLKPSKELL